jgi:hypothetical protein
MQMVPPSDIAAIAALLEAARAAYNRLSKDAIGDGRVYTGSGGITSD